MPLLQVQIEPLQIRPEKLIAAVAHEEAGATCLFLGTVRGLTEGVRTVELEYEAYEAMALAEMQALAEDAAARWPLQGVALVHRTGRLAVGEVAVGVCVAAAHRQEAFEACRYLIDTLKMRVPIWKKEFYSDGISTWIEG